MSSDACGMLPCQEIDSSIKCKWGDPWYLFAINIDKETSLTRPSKAWDVEDGWCNPVKDLPDPAPNILNSRSPRQTPDGKGITTDHLQPQVHPIWTLRAQFYGGNAPVRDLNISLGYIIYFWIIVIDPWGEEKFYIAHVEWSSSILDSIRINGKNPFTEANLAKLRSFGTAPKFKQLMKNNTLLCVLLGYMFGYEVGEYTYISTF